jgi:hypothetical protein
MDPYLNKDAAELSAASIFLSGPTIFRLILTIKFSHHSDGFTILGFAQAGVSFGRLDFCTTLFLGCRDKEILGFSQRESDRGGFSDLDSAWFLGCRIIWFLRIWIGVF